MAWLGITFSEVIRLIVYHDMPHYVVGSQVLFNKQDVRRWATEHRERFLLRIRLDPPKDPSKPKK